MASIWTIFTKGYAEYEMEKMQEPFKKMSLDLTFRQGFWNCSDYEIQEAYEFAKRCW